MKDWKGNTIKVGDTIVVINKEQMFAGNEVGLCRMNENGEWEFESLGIDKPRHKWEIQNKIEVTPPSSECTIYTSRKENDLIPINQIDFCCPIQPFQVCCIEGVSDNEEEYYLEFFKD